MLLSDDFSLLISPTQNQSFTIKSFKMKILKYVIGLFCFLLLAFFAMGIFTPMVNYQSEVEVNKPVKEAWAVFNDASRMQDWIPAYRGIEHIEGNEGEVGSKYLVKMEEAGEIFEMVETLTAMDPMERFAMEIESDMMTQDLDVKFKAKDENTTIIKVTGEITGKGIINKSVFAMMKNRFQESNDEFYGNLKRVIEENTKDYFPVEPMLEAELSEDAEDTDGM